MTNNVKELCEKYAFCKDCPNQKKCFTGDKVLANKTLRQKFNYRNPEREAL